MCYLAVNGTGEVEDIQQRGVSEVPQPRDAGQGQRLQLAVRWTEEKCDHKTWRGPVHVVKVMCRDTQRVIIRVMQHLTALTSHMCHY